MDIKNEKFPNISARALGVLMVATQMGEGFSAAKLSEMFSEGIKALESSLRELRENNYVELVRNRTASGRVVSINKVTGFGRGLVDSIIYRDNWSDITNSTFSKEPVPTSTVSESSKDKTIYVMPEIKKSNPRGRPRKAVRDPHDPAIRKDEQERYENAQESKWSEVYETHRANYPMRNWTATDTTYEFAHRLRNRWDIPPWQVSRTKFAPALKSARLKFNGNGELEYEMMNKFFAIPIYRTIKDANQLWKMFVSQYSTLIAEAGFVVKDPIEMEVTARRQQISAITQLIDDPKEAWEIVTKHNKAFVLELLEKENFRNLFFEDNAVVLESYAKEREETLFRFLAEKEIPYGHFES